MKEIGGYIEFEHFQGSEFHSNALALNSGRHCLEYLIRARHISKLYIPYFLCGSVKGVCDRLGVLVEYYQTNLQFLPFLKKPLTKGSWLYIVNYYGQLSYNSILALKDKYGCIIVDNVQAFFQMPVENVDTLYSCRKFFGVSDGAYLYTDALLDDELEQDYSFDRMLFLFGRQEKTASEFYKQYTDNNKRFLNENLKKMSKATQNILRGINYEFVRKIRTENFVTLHQWFKDLNRLSLVNPVGAYMYPLYIEGGAEIRRKLQEEMIYIPILWSDVFYICAEQDLEFDLALNILPIPVDQRYGVDDMEYIVKQIMRFMK